MIHWYVFIESLHDKVARNPVAEKSDVLEDKIWFVSWLVTGDKLGGIQKNLIQQQFGLIFF